MVGARVKVMVEGRGWRRPSGRGAAAGAAATYARTPASNACVNW
jgi:hypothetical protein